MTKADRMSIDNDRARSSNHVSPVQKSKCDCQCGLLVVELEWVKLDLVILKKNVDTEIMSAQKTHDYQVAQLRHNYANERERCEQLESGISILVRGIEALHASLRKSVSEQSTKYIQNNYDMSKTSERLNNYANSMPFPMSDDLYIKSSNNIESPPPLPPPSHYQITLAKKKPLIIKEVPN